MTSQQGILQQLLAASLCLFLHLNSLGQIWPSGKPSPAGAGLTHQRIRNVHTLKAALGLVLAANLRVKSLPAPRAGGLMGAVPPRCRLAAAQTKGDPRQVSASTWHFPSYRGSWQSEGVRFTGTAKAKKKHAKSERRWCQQQKVERGRLEGNHQSKVG